MKTNWMKEAAILTIGLIVLGYSLRGGIESFIEKERVVSVKGLAEKEVAANKVTWPLTFKVVGNDLTDLYNHIKQGNRTITAYLKSNGISEDEISINAPEIIDMKAERYNSNNTPYRYNVTSIIIVTSNQVDKVRQLLAEQSELLKQGIALTSDDYRYSIQYEYTLLNDIKPQMIEEATRAARQAGEQFAKDSDSRLGKIKRASQGQFSISDRDANTPHIKHIRVVTTVDYFLKD